MIFILDYLGADFGPLGENIKNLSDSESIFILTDNKLITLIGESIIILIDLRSFFPIRDETVKVALSHTSETNNVLGPVH